LVCGASNVQYAAKPTVLGGACWTVTVTSAVVVSAPSDAERRRTYVPATAKEAVVVRDDGSEKVTLPGPETMDHAMMRMPDGRPSSCTLPVNDAAFGKVTVRLEPADTVGGRFAGRTVIVASALAVRAVSEAVKRKT
jgi:hypothetical protein